MPGLFLPLLSAIVALLGAVGIAVAPPAPVEPAVETLPASWRLGERVVLIDGARPLD